MNTVFIPCACIKQSTVCIVIQKRNSSLGKYSFGFCYKKSGYFTKPVKNITNGIFICHKQVNNDTKSNSYSLKRQQNYFCNRTFKRCCDDPTKDNTMEMLFYFVNSDIRDYEEILTELMKTCYVGTNSQPVSYTH